MKLPKSAMQEAAFEVVKKLRKCGHEAFLAGGCVRDLLLGREPHDFDVATSARPEEIQEMFPKTVAVGAQFGVIVVLHRLQEIQVATFRADGKYQDGRHPESVVFTNAEGDAQRRDFTVNALFYDVEEERVIDFVGGVADIEKKILRAVGNAGERFEEDKLRVLRAVRFGAVLGFSIEESTWEGVVANASKIQCVSGERIREELLKIFLSPARVAGFDLLDRSGLLEEILPEVSALKGCEQPPEFHPEGDVFVHTRLMLSLLPQEVSAALVLSVLFHDIGKPATQVRDETGRFRFNGHERVSAEMTEPILQRLRFSNAEIEKTVEAVRNHMAFKDVQCMRKAKLKRFLARPTWEDEMELHRVDCLGSHGMLDNYEFLLRKREEFASEPLIPAPLVTGRDLLEMGLKPGPIFREILEGVQTLQLEGGLVTREDALGWLKENVSGEGWEGKVERREK